MPCIFELVQQLDCPMASKPLRLQLQPWSHHKTPVPDCFWQLDEACFQWSKIILDVTHIILVATSAVRHIVQLAALVAVLKPARQLGLADSILCMECSGEEPIAVPKEAFYRAICHSSEELQTDTMQLICSYPKVTLMPSRWSAIDVLTGYSACFKAPLV